jgi:hypothetical protein
MDNAQASNGPPVHARMHGRPACTLLGCEQAGSNDDTEPYWMGEASGTSARNSSVVSVGYFGVIDLDVCDGICPIGKPQEHMRFIPHVFGNVTGAGVRHDGNHRNFA